MDRYSIESLLKNEIGENETFAFDCKMCGECCKNRDKDLIVLTGADIFRAARVLGITTEGFIAKYCRVHIGQQSRCPVVTLRAKIHDGACPLLKNGKCSIQSDKPVVCAIYPLGRWYNTSDGTFHYFTQKVRCRGNISTKSQTPSEWASHFNHEEADRYAVAFTRLLNAASSYMRGVPEEAMTQDLMNIMLGLLYCGYSYGEGSPSYEEQIDKRINDMNLFTEFKKTTG